MPLEIQSVSKSFDRFPALKDVSLKAEDGEFLALLGPSGSGKTTLLRILAGLETPDTGQVRFEGQDFLSQTPRQRRVGLVFQHYALFRHMTVARNIAFGLKVRSRRERPSKSDINARVQELLKLVQLEDLGGRYPAQLSGGQRQRVALARALAIEPRILLLDEPFGALDAKVRRDLRRWLRHIHDETGVTTVFVTHDQEEAIDLADRVAILKDGQLQQVDTPQALYERPANPFVHDFLGASLELEAEVVDGEVHAHGWRGPAPADATPGPALLCVRPDTLRLADDGLQARVISISARGALMRVECEIEGRILELDRPSDDPLTTVKPGASVRLSPARFHLYPR
ncbi:sulfate/molybdate ABC transporter ATP-binding protein [Brevundimonas sp.]|uniref:sulfate/molybdate ABC transporter ATP-binding protein n=1 Tax=Brevundimonas sp. TaxID=1871086 RepID=UPI00391A8B8E